MLLPCSTQIVQHKLFASSAVAPRRLFSPVCALSGPRRRARRHCMILTGSRDPPCLLWQSHTTRTGQRVRRRGVCRGCPPGRRTSCLCSATGARCRHRREACCSPRSGTALDQRLELRGTLCRRRKAIAPPHGCDGGVEPRWQPRQRSGASCV